MSKIYTIKDIIIGLSFESRGDYYTIKDIKYDKDYIILILFHLNSKSMVYDCRYWGNSVCGYFNDGYWSVIDASTIKLLFM